MKNWWKWLAAAAVGAAVLVAGCGGGGGSAPLPTDDNGNTAITYPFSGRFVELMNGTTRLDPLNLRVGDTGTLVLVSFSAAGTRTILPVSSWALSGGTGVTLNTVTGGFTVTSRPSGFFTIKATPTTGTEVDQEAFVPTATTTVRGTVNAGATSYGMRFIQVEFYNGGGTRIGASRTDGNGRFSARVDNAASVTILAESIPTASAGTYSGFYRMIRYNGKYYTAGGTTCPIDVGPFSVGADTSLPYALRPALQTAGPPPFPDGCSL